MFEFLDQVNDDRKKELQPLLMLLGGTTGVGKSRIAGLTFPKEMKGCQITLAGEAHAYESAGKRCYHIPLHKKPIGDGEWEELDESDQYYYLEELIKSDELAERFDYVVIESGNLDSIFRKLGEYLSSKYNRAEILDQTYDLFFRWCSDLRDKGVHVIVTMPYLKDSNGDMVPTIIGRTGPTFAGKWPHRMYLKRSDNETVWDCAVSVNKDSKKQDGTSFANGVEGARLGEFDPKPLHDKPASIETLLKYMEHMHKKNQEG